MSKQDYHIPVMLKECLEGLNLKPEGVYVDVTFGGGGHSREILACLGDKGKLFAFDKDIEAHSNNLNDPRFTLIKADFRYLAHWLQFYGVDKIDGLLADLGISSHHIDKPERGFSTRFHGPLDMRMDETNELSAAEIVNSYEKEDLMRIIRLYGELPGAHKIAELILRARALKPIETTTELIDILKPVSPRGKEFKFQAQVFQALRIEVNDELLGLQEMLTQSAQMLREGGRLVVMSYHSLEDRLVKNFVKTGSFEGNITKDIYGNDLKPFNPLHNKPIEATDAELAINSRARSAKLRVAERNNFNVSKA